jgi:periplasmic protein TonB
MICFVVAFACHGLATVVILANATAATDFDIDRPVVLLDLPESRIITTASPTDSAPGPLQEEDSLPTPPQNVDTEPPKPQSEVALAIPDRPNPEPPSEEKQASAPQPTKTPPKSVVRWQGLLAIHIERFKRYPAAARAHHDEGVVTVEFTIDRGGHVLESHIVKTSGVETLDQETLALLERAQPLPRPPENVRDNDLSFVAPVRFNIR